MQRAETQDVPLVRPPLSRPPLSSGREQVARDVSGLAKVQGGTAGLGGEVNIEQHKNEDLGGPTTWIWMLTNLQYNPGSVTKLP